MFNTTLIVRCNWYFLINRKGKQRLQYRYSEDNLRGEKVFVFRTERGATKKLFQIPYQDNLGRFVQDKSAVDKTMQHLQSNEANSNA